MISAIVMASGFSRRMGQNKLLMKYKDKYIIEHLLDTLKKCKLDKIIVVSQYEEILSLCEQYGFLKVKNNNAHLGQSESIKLGVKKSGICDGYMFFVADQPLIDTVDINKLIDEFLVDEEYIVRPISNEKMGNPTIMPFSKKDELLSLKNDEGGKHIIKNHDKIKFVNVNENSLFDVDTLDDFNNLIYF